MACFSCCCLKVHHGESCYLFVHPFQRVEQKLKGEEGETAEMGSPDSTEQEHRAVSVENLLSRINNSGSVIRSDDSSSQENSSSGKLHQLLESNSRSDTVVAS